MCIGPKGDRVKVPTIECARRMIKAGADIIGLNCLFDPIMCLDAMKDFKAAVDELPPGVKKPHLMAQPNGYFTQDCGRAGWLHTDGFPFGKKESGVNILADNCKLFAKRNLQGQKPLL